MGLGGWWEGPVSDVDEVHCDYCTQLMHSVQLHEFDDPKTWRTLRVRTCETCGWWILDRSDGDPHGETHYVRVSGEARHFPGLSREIDLEDAYLRIVSRERARTRVLEKCLGAFLGGWLGKVDVEIIGRSDRDNADLTLLTTPQDAYLLSVERGTEASSGERVHAVDSVVGVIFRHGVTRGLVLDGRNLREQYTVKEGFALSKLRIPTQQPYQPWKSLVPGILELPYFGSR